MPKLPKFHHTLNQPPRSPNGRNRKPSPKAHRDPADRAGGGAGGAVAVIRTSFKAGTWRTFNFSTVNDPSSFAVDPAAQAAFRACIDDMTNHVITDWDLSAPLALHIPYAGVRTGEIIAYRAWLVTADGLSSLAHYRLWKPDETVEGDINEIVDRSYKAIHGGVYASKNWETVLEQTNDERHKSYPFQMVPRTRLQDALLYGAASYTMYVIYGLAIGRVKLWGEVVEHEFGYRAQFGKLVSLERVYGLADLEKLRSQYGV